MIDIYTSSWMTAIEPGISRIGISRGSMRFQKGYKMMRSLAPGSWFKTVDYPEYIARFNAEILADLDPARIVSHIEELSDGQPAVLLCYENPQKIHVGELFCHRHLVAQWLEDSLSIEVKEYDFPDLDRFHLLRKRGLDEPKY